ncbi:MAG: hypothetical protein AAF531_18525 [Actinomycetota bacterium]
MLGRRLSEVEIESYDLCPEPIARRVRVIRIPLIPGGYAGMTLGRTVLLAKDVARDGTSSLMAHELVHARQWTDQGLFRFAWAYTSSFTRNFYTLRSWNKAYHQIDAELEAKQETADWLIRQARDQKQGRDPI